VPGQEKEQGETAPAKPKRKPAKESRRALAKAIPPSNGPRRAIFIDVENTSSEADLVRALETLQIDHVAQQTELTAVGNWRTAAQKVARRLASLGARLVHSAPVTGVRDWSDLWIATAAGVWIGQSGPGDKLEIISDDRAFDAVGDVALARGIDFRRISHRARVSASASPSEGTNQRRTSSRRRRRSSAASREMPREEPAAVRSDEAHAAPLAAIHELMTELSEGRVGGWVNLDVLENALKASGFSRPPGSPRLVTRLRKLKDFEVSAHGKVRLVGDG
jgi:hypothetical protein